MDDASLAAAIEAFGLAIDRAGSLSALARIAGCTPGNIWQLRKKGSPLPGKYVLAVEQGTGISRHDLRSDLYPRDDTPLSVSHSSVESQADAVPCDRTGILQPDNDQ